MANKLDDETDIKNELGSLLLHGGTVEERDMISVNVMRSSLAKKNKVLLFILLVPFYIPTFIFAIGAVELEMIQQSPDKNFYILIGIFMITFSISSAVYP